MVAPVRKDYLSKHQLALATMLRIISPVSGIFTGTELQMDPNSRDILVPDIRVDDYIVDTELGRIGADHYSGSAFTGEWKNALPPIEWRRYSMSRHRSFGYVVYDDQVKYSPIPNLPQAYVSRKMETTVVRDHDKYVLSAIINGHMTGKQVARVDGVDSPGPQTSEAHLIAHTGNAADYKWIAEPGESFDNEIQPSFATITGMVLDDADPLKTIDALTLAFSTNWFDSNFANAQRVLIITPAHELAIINYLIEKGAGTETALDMLRNGDISGFEGAGYIGTLKGSWRLIKMHPEFFPKVFVDGNNVVQPMATTATAGVTLKQVVALAAYTNAAQTYENFSEQRSQDGGTRFKGTEYVQDFSYDAWVIDQFSEGIVPLFLPSSPTKLKTINDVFVDLAATITAARAQTSVSPETYPITQKVGRSRPDWYHDDFTSEGVLNNSLTVKQAGDIGVSRRPILEEDNPFDAAEAADLEERVGDLEA